MQAVSVVVQAEIVAVHAVAVQDDTVEVQAVTAGSVMVGPGTVIVTGFGAIAAPVVVLSVQWRV